MRTQWLCDQLDELKVAYFREPFMNIVTIQSQFINGNLVKKFDLVPQKHNGANSWYKIVIMDHVEVDHLSTFISDLNESFYVEKGIKSKV